MSSSPPCGRPTRPLIVLAAAVLAPLGASAQEPAPAQSGAAGGSARNVLPQVVVSAPRVRSSPPRRTTVRGPVPSLAPAPAPVQFPVTPATAGPPGVPVVVPNVVAPPAGLTVTTIGRDRFELAPAFSIGEILQDSPGISIKQGNGPRDVGISIRGSNARNGFGIRNIVMFEDGFPVTQPDGLSRTDLTDPHAYAGIDVYRGPSSALFGNYATGGAVNFRTRTGAQIDGFEYGSDVGQFGYFNNYVTLGGKSGLAEFALFASDVRGDGFIANSMYDTQTVNFLGTYAPTPDDTLTFKFINNTLDARLPIRLSLTQFQQNPFQHGCTIASVAAPGCASVNLFINGFSAPTIAQTAEQAGLGRDDRRTIGGLRWEHRFDNQTTWRTQFVFDDKNISQPTGATSAVGDSPAGNFITGLRRQDRFFALDATHSVDFYANYQVLNNLTYNVAPGGNATLGRLSSGYDGGHHYNVGGRVREEVKLDPHWTGVFGAAVEYTDIAAVNNLYTYPGGVTRVALVPVEREFLNAAPEAALLFRPNSEWQVRARLATGYGTPQISNLLITPQGVSGNNTQLQPQQNLGYDLGVDWTPVDAVKLSVTGFYEFFRNELVTQSPGAGLQNFTFNAPASEHRGVEVAADWRPSPGWRFTAAYTFLDQVYTDYTEQLSAGAVTSRFDRAGNKIPGVAPNELTARLGYDQPTGPLQGLGGFVEYVWKDGFFTDNGNVLRAPGYDLVNLNLHYNIDLVNDHFRRFGVYAEVKNVFDKTYVASANNITDTINAVTGAQNPAAVLATATGSIYAGAPRTFLAGLRLAFR